MGANAGGSLEALLPWNIKENLQSWTWMVVKRVEQAFAVLFLSTRLQRDV